MTARQSHSVCLAITRLRLGVIICCWIVGTALGYQVLVWSLATYTQLRYELVEEPAAEAPLIVTAEPQQSRAGRILPPGDVASERSGDDPRLAPPEMRPSALDGFFRASSDILGGAGRVAMAIVLLIMGLGVMISSGSALPGVHQTVSAFMWSLLVAVIVLPLGHTLNLPWSDGALTTYAHMTGVIESMEAGRAGEAADPAKASHAEAPSTMVFFGRFLLLPIACLVGVALVGLRFCAGVEEAVLRGESMKLDPALEKEAANVKPSSLHGGRAASILSRTIGQRGGESEPPPPRRTRPVTASTIGESAAEDAPPKRLI